MREAELARVRDALASLCALPLPTPGAPPLAISTLRGQFADNGEWCIAPSRPAVVIELTATSRSAKANAKPFGLDENPDDKATDNEIVQGRVNAVKKLSLLPVTKITDGKDKANGADVRAKIVDLALAKKDSDRAVLIFVRSVDLRRRGWLTTEHPGWFAMAARKPALAALAIAVGTSVLLPRSRERGPVEV